jgi:hypothetical protein
MTDTGCFDCHHAHAGPELGNICIGCPCQTRPLKVSDLHRFGCMTKGCHTAMTSRRNLTAAEADSEARMKGWIVWSGTTLNGADSTGIYCPEHGNRAAQADDPEDAETGFDAECENCFTTASEDWGSDFDGTEECAEEWMEDHTCEPTTRLIRPTRKQAVA